jgi:hypothetical protein
VVADSARAHDALIADVAAPMVDRSFGKTIWTVERWNEEQTDWAMEHLDSLMQYRVQREGFRLDGSAFHAMKIRPYLVTEVVGNLITNAGWTRLMNLLTAQSATQALDATHARIGVGNSNTAEAYTDTDLGAAAGSANRWFQLVSGAGTLGTRTLAFSATFGTADGNFAWNEFGLDFGTANGNTVTAPLFNHKASIAQGTKASGQTWTATATLTFT